jgi:HEAT repeat protein
MAEMLEKEFGFLTELERYDAFVRLYRSPKPEDKDELERLYSSGDPLIPLILLQYLEELPEKAAVLAVLRLLETGNDVVSSAAMSAYRRNHYPGKPRLLKQLILSESPRACRFAVRTLSRAGFMEILPLLLREIPERKGPVQAEMVDALRFLPDRRSLPVLIPLSRAPEERTRLLALRALVELQARGRVLPLDFFLKLSQDESELIRRAALEALERFPSKRVAPLILDVALDEKRPEESRARALRALARFPDEAWAKPVVELVASSHSQMITLSAEVALHAFHEKEMRRGLLPLLKDPRPEIQRQAAHFLAELLPEAADIRGEIFKLWRESPHEAALELSDTLRALGGADTAALLREAIGGPELLSYAAATALAELRGRDAGPIIVEYLERPSISPLIHQQLLSRWNRREPEPAIRERLLAHAFKALADPTINVRYMALQILAWYPIETTIRPILDFLTREAQPDIAQAAIRRLSRDLGADPLPLVEAVRAHPKAKSLLGHAMRILTGQSWDPRRSVDLLAALRQAPLSLLDELPETYLAVATHLIEQGSAGLEEVWESIPDARRRKIFLALLASFMADTRRRFPALPLAWLSDRLERSDEAARRLFYELLLADGSNASLECLTVNLARESDPAIRAHTAARLKRRLLEETP